jgi:hypothetical protein
MVVFLLFFFNMCRLQNIFISLTDNFINFLDGAQDSVLKRGH